LSNIKPRIPLRLLAVVEVVVACFLSGLLLGERPPTLVPFFAGLVPVILFLRPVVVVDEPVILVVGDAPEPVLLYFFRTIFL
jgi:hypothetical protein